MSVDYSVRMNAVFTLDQLRTGTELSLAQLVPNATERTVDVLTDVPIPIPARLDGLRATMDDLARQIGGTTPLLANALVVAPAGAVVRISELDIGYDEDAEGGRWFLSTPWDLTAASHLLSIAVIVAAARLAGAPVDDELSQLTGQMWADPEDIVARLRRPGAVRRLRDVAPDVLARVGITRPGWGGADDADPRAG